MDPQHRLLLETAWRAVEHSGTAPSALADTNTGVFVGLSTHDYLAMASDELAYPEIEAYLAIGTSNAAAAGRISYRLGLQGPAVAVDTACSSSLVAIHQACQALRLGECDLALAGGANVLLSPATMITFSSAQMLAPDGRCKTFDAAADGYVRGEGCGVIVIKRLEDKNVGQMHPAVERIVHDEHVARRDVASEVAHDRGHGGRHRAQMPGQGEALRDELAVGVGERGGIIHVVLEHARIGGAEDGQRHLVGDGEDRVLEQLEGDGIEVVGHEYLSFPDVHHACRALRRNPTEKATPIGMNR